MEGGEGFAFFAAEGADGFGGAFAVGAVAGDLVLGVAVAALMALAGGLAVSAKLTGLSVLSGLLSLALLLT